MQLGFIETAQLRIFEYVGGWSGGHDMNTPGRPPLRPLLCWFFAAGIKYGISDFADAAYDVLHDENIRIKGPDDVLDYREEPITKVVPEDIYELEERIGQPATELKEMFVYHRASKIEEQDKYCSHGYHVKSCEDEKCKSGLVDLRTRFPTFHRDLYDALLQVKEEYKEVFEDHKGD